MTVSTTTSRVEYAGNGSTTAFAVPFYFLANGDLKVYQSGTLKTITTHYTVSGAGNPAGGTVTFGTAPTSGQSVVILRDPALTQSTDYVANDPFPADSHERALDRLTMIAQRNRELGDRSFRLADGDTSGASTVLPTPSASKLVGWNSSANALQNYDPGDIASVVTYANWRVQTFTGNGSTTSFTLTSSPVNVANTDVSIDGVTQVPGTDYSLSGDGMSLVFGAAPANGSVICARYGQAAVQGRDDASIIYYQPAGTGAVSRSVQNKLRESVSVTDYGAVGDGVTDDLAAFNAAKTAAAAANRAIYIPAPKVAGKYYKLSAAWVLDASSLSVFGDGVSSCVVSHSATGDDAIRITADHVSVRDIGISGISTSGSGLHINTSTGVGGARIEGVWVGWMGVDGFRITKGQSNTFTDCSVDQNSGYRPITLTSGTEGGCVIGYHILSASGGNTNNTTFVNCRANAGGSSYNVKFGDSTPGNPLLESCHWFGGVIQGSGNYEEVAFVNAKDCTIQSTHIEPPAGSYSGYVVSMQGCRNCVIRNTNIQGDSRFLNCSLCGFQNVRTMGISIDSDSENCFFYDGDYENNASGPLGGKIKDYGQQTVFRNLLNSANERYTYGDSLPTKHEYFSTNMQYWVGGASPTVPCGFANYASATVEREGTIKKSFDYSCKITSASGAKGIRTRIGPVNYLQGKRILVEAWVYNASENGLGAVEMLVDNSANFALASTSSSTWEKMLVTFDVPTTATASIDLLFVALDAGTVYFDSIAIWVEGDYQQVTEVTLDGTATPAISYPTVGAGGYPVPTLRTSGTPTITNFVDPHVGVPFTILFDGATVIQDNATIQLSGGSNFTGTTNDTLTLVYGTDGVFREVSRSVN